MAASLVFGTKIITHLISSLDGGLLESCKCLPQCLNVFSSTARPLSKATDSRESNPPLKKPFTPVGKHDDPQRHRDAEKEPMAPFPNNVNPKTREKGGPRGPEPTRYGDWERKGRCIDF